MALTVPDGPSRRRGIALGQAAARAILARRDGDGWDTPGTYAFVPGAGISDDAALGRLRLQPGFRDARPFGLSTATVSAGSAARAGQPGVR